jgi:hypothetical protein
MGNTDQVLNSANGVVVDPSNETFRLAFHVTRSLPSGSHVVMRKQGPQRGHTMEPTNIELR